MSEKNKDIKIGRVSFSPVWIGLDYGVFVKKYAKFEKRTGLKINDAAKKLGIEIPKKTTSETDKK